MYKITTFLLAVLILAGCSSKKGVFNDDYAETTPPSHKVWDDLLHKYVNDQGWVDYKGFVQDSSKLNGYLESLEKSPPNTKKWSKEERMVYWINAYNAYTVQLISRNYPLESIKDIADGLKIPFVSTTWDIKFIEIGGKKFDLNNLEHGILRKEFSDPRVHFALVCASYSCPPLRAEAFVADRLSDQLDDQARIFINDTRKNKTGENPPQLSKIFNWYGMDFKDKMPVIDYVNQYADNKIAEGADLQWMEYKWTLNEQGKAE